MNDAKRNWMLAGGLWLATSTGLPTTADELHFSGREQSAAKADESQFSDAEPLIVSPERTAEVPLTVSRAAPPKYYYQCPPPVRQSAFSRWHQRHKAQAQAKYLGYPEEFHHAPLGMMVNAHIETSIAKGQASRMVLYQYDFVPGSDQLKPRGKAQAAKIAAWLPFNPYPVFVEPSGDSFELDEARRQSVWREFAATSCPIPGERVVVGYASSRGLEGLEAELIDQNRLNQTGSRGMSGGTAGSGTSSSQSTGADNSTEGSMEQGP